MPIVKIPLKHKFGIVSLSRAEGLLIKKRQADSRETQKSSPGPLEITLEFVSKYNKTRENMRGSLDTLVQSSLLHAKYKAGVGRAESGDVSYAWLELSLLCQCYGQYQQDALLLLALSLGHAPLSEAHIESLLYIAGLCFQWLKSKELSETVLRTGELLLLKIVYLTTQRLHYHHLTRALADATRVEDIGQLKDDLEGFEVREKMYRNFPEALLQWKLSLEIGLLICESYGGNTAPESRVSPHTACSNSQGAASVQSSPHPPPGLAPILWHTLDVWQCINTGNEALGEALADLLGCSTNFDPHSSLLEGALAMSLLCVASQLNLASIKLLQSLAAGSSRPSTQQKAPSLSDKSTTPPESPRRETRFILPEDMTSQSRQRRKPSTLNVLGAQPEFDAALLGSAVTLLTQFTMAVDEEDESSYHSSPVASTVGTQSLIESVVIPSPPPSTHTSHTNSALLDSTTTDLSLGLSKSNPLLHSENKSLYKLITVSGHSNADERINLLDTIESVDSQSDMESQKKVVLQSPTNTCTTFEPIEDCHTLQQQSPASYYAHSHAPLSDGVAVLGSQVAPSTVYRRSVFSTPDQHLGSLEDNTVSPGLQSWSTEVSLLYTLGMADCVLYGHSSLIQRCALLGDEDEGGLVGLAQYSNSGSHSSTDMSWTVRHAAVLGLSRVVRVCGHVAVQDGFSHVARGALTEAHAHEKEPKVLEAFKLAQACPDLDKALLSLDKVSFSSPLLAHIANGLSRHFLPPISTALPPVKSKHKRVVTAPARTEGKDLTASLSKVQPKVSTRTGVPHVASFNSRRMGALNAIAEEHWKRQMKEQEKQEEQERVAAEEVLKKEYEEKMRKKEEKLARNKRPHTHQCSHTL